jgi:predicted membrane chloride channel (bestrophin family)
MIPITSALSLFLFGIEELATQLEEPFTILPMQAFCDKIYNWCTEIVSFSPGDSGMPIYKNKGNTQENPGTLIK